MRAARDRRATATRVRRALPALAVAVAGVIAVVVLSTSSERRTSVPHVSRTAPHDRCLQLQSGLLYPVSAGLDACGYPSPGTAGIPSAAHLTTVSSTCRCLPPHTTWNGWELIVTGPTTIRNLNIPGGIVIERSDFSNPLQTGVVLDHDRVSAGGFAAGPIINLQGTGGTRIAYTTVGGVRNGVQNCADPAGSDVGDPGGSNTLDHDYFDCAGEPINGSGYTVTNSYVIVDGYPPGAHAEDIYIPGGGSGDIEHNTLLVPQSATAEIFGDAKGGSLSNVTVKDNLFAGGGYGDGVISMACGNSRNVTIETNRFSGAYGSNDPGAVDTGATWTGNYVDGSLTAVAEPIRSC